MTIVVYAEASAADYPGHMVVGQEPTDGPRYYGFRFDPADLPEDHRRPEHWRRYLFDHAVRGLIVDETAYVCHLLAGQARVYSWKCADCASQIEEGLPPRGEWVPHAWYSFDPDTDRPGQQPCYNCVKWAVLVANSLVTDFLPPVHQWRLKLILEQLEPYEPRGGV